MINKSKGPLIRVEKVDVTYNEGESNEVRSLVDANLKLYPEEYVIIFGPSGCGKSTLLYTIAGLQKPSKGKVFINDQSIYDLGKKEKVEFHRRKIGLVFQDFYLIPSLNVLDNVCLPKTAGGAGNKKRNEEAQTLLNRFGIANQTNKMPSELSGGQKQRVSIARSLSNNPDIILADEPVGNLDSISKYNVMKILDDLNKKDKKMIILVTHDASHLRYGDRILYMHDGKIIKEEIIKDKMSPDNSMSEEISSSEKVSPDLKMLMRAFQDLSISQVGVLLAPFKAQQLFSHIMLSKTYEQINRSNKGLEDLLMKNLSFDEFVEKLDVDMSKGGAGWDKRNAKSFAKKAVEIISIKQKVDPKKPKQSAKILLDYLIKTFELKFTDEQKKRSELLLSLRIKNKISVAEIGKGFDLPLQEGGCGLDKRLAEKLSREVEIIMLLNYG
jgi:putative ABC transport system ATP-binding protein